jgi:GTP-binding protein
MLAGVRAQAQVAIDEADAIIFMVDVEAGPTPDDFEIASILRRTAKPVYLVVNKADNEKREQEGVEFYQLGLGEPIILSALHGVGVGELLDRIIADLPEHVEEERLAVPHLAIVGRPNVGKSSLLNALLGEDRALVSEIAGTTRDAVDTDIVWDGQPLVLIDTAGLRRRGHIDPGIEKYSSLRALRAIERADVALLVIDAVEGVMAQDQHVAHYILEQGKGVVIVANKWDLVEKETKTMDEYIKRIRSALDFIAYAPIVFVSAKTHQRVRQVIDKALDVRTAWEMRVPDQELNELLREATTRHTPPVHGKRELKFYSAEQTHAAPPTFVFSVNDKKMVHFTYERYLENQIRARWAFEGAPIRMMFRNKRPSGS